MLQNGHMVSKTYISIKRHAWVNCQRWTVVHRGTAGGPKLQSEGKDICYRPRCAGAFWIQENIPIHMRLILLAKYENWLRDGYIPLCIDCQWNKSSMTKSSGPLHPLPMPNRRCESIAMDFIGPLPLDNGCDYLLTITDRLGSDLHFVPTTKNITTKKLAMLFFDNQYCENGLPKEIICERDKLFVSKFWKHLMLLTRIKTKMSTAYHPQTYGASEWTNKTLEQCLRFHVERNQKGWKWALPRVQFQMMNTINKSTKFMPF